MFAYGPRPHGAVKSLVIALLLSFSSFVSGSSAEEVSRSAAAQAAYDYLVRYLNADALMLVYSGHFESIGGDICRVKAVENLVFAKLTLVIRMADVDLDSLQIKGSQLRAINVSTAAGKSFQLSAYDAQKKKWTDWVPSNDAALLIDGGNENTILRAFDTLAKECGAKSNGF